MIIITFAQDKALIICKQTFILWQRFFYLKKRNGKRAKTKKKMKKK